MADTAEALLLAVFALATSIWLGGYVAIAVVARSAATTLDPASRVAFFRSLGRSYLWVGLPALFVALGTGAALARDLEWDGLLITTAAVAVILVVSLMVAVGQARRMTRLRRRALSDPADSGLAEQVRRGARAAGVLRAVLGLLSLALLVLGSFLAV